MKTVNLSSTIIKSFIGNDLLVYKKSISNGDDMNNYTGIGMYGFNNVDYVIHNCPVDYGTLIVLSRTNHIIQVIMNNYGTMYRRHKWRNSSFSEWRLVPAETLP